LSVIPLRTFAIGTAASYRVARMARPEQREGLPAF